MIFGMSGPPKNQSSPVKEEKKLNSPPGGSGRSIGNLQINNLDQSLSKFYALANP